MNPKHVFVISCVRVVQGSMGQRGRRPEARLEHFPSAERAFTDLSKASKVFAERQDALEEFFETQPSDQEMESLTVNRRHFDPELPLNQRMVEVKAVFEDYGEGSDKEITYTLTAYTLED